MLLNIIFSHPSLELLIVLQSLYKRNTVKQRYCWNNDTEPVLTKHNRFRTDTCEYHFEKAVLILTNCSALAFFKTVDKWQTSPTCQKKRRKWRTSLPLQLEGGYSRIKRRPECRFSRALASRQIWMSCRSLQSLPIYYICQRRALRWRLPSKVR